MLIALAWYLLFIKGMPELQHEKFILVQDYFERKAILAIPPIEEDVGCIINILRHVAGNKLYIESKSVCQHHNAIIPIIWW